jgi:hypothetical protein
MKRLSLALALAGALTASASWADEFSIRPKAAPSKVERHHVKARWAHRYRVYPRRALVLPGAIPRVSICCDFDEWELYYW